MWLSLGRRRRKMWIISFGKRKYIDLIECRGAHSHSRSSDLLRFHIITNPFRQFLRFIIRVEYGHLLSHYYVKCKQRAGADTAVLLKWNRKKMIEYPRQSDTKRKLKTEDWTEKEIISSIFRSSSLCFKTRIMIIIFWSEFKIHSRETLERETRSWALYNIMAIKIYIPYMCFHSRNLSPHEPGENGAQNRRRLQREKKIENDYTVLA